MDLQKSSAVLKAYNGSAIKHVRYGRKLLLLNDATHAVTFFVVKKGRQALLGLHACKQLGLVPKCVDSVRWSEPEPEKAFPDLFQGTGCVGRRYRMVLREDVVPVVHPARRVPLALREPLRQELERMETASIIKKVDEPTEWASPLVITRKKGGALRVCIDPREINKSIKREHYPMPTREEIEAELSGATFFSRLDAKAGFHQIPLDAATS